MGSAVLTSTDGYIDFLLASLLAVTAVEGVLVQKLGPHFEALRAVRIQADLL